MSDERKNVSLIEVVKRNGDFRRNYGVIVGSFLFLRSLSAARDGTTFPSGLVAIATAGIAALLQKHDLRVQF